jgi:hypothetical protein
MAMGPRRTVLSMHPRSDWLASKPLPGRTRCFPAIVVALLGACLLHGCGTESHTGFLDDAGPGGPFGGSSSGGAGSGSGSGAGGSGGSGGIIIIVPGDAGTISSDAGGGSSSGVGIPPPVATVIEPDCMAPCPFPPAGASACGSGPSIKIAYPPDTVLLPPNLNVMSVQWTPYGGPYTRFSVDFSNPATGTDWHLVTSCRSQTTDMQTAPPAPSGGCEVTIDPVSWSSIVAANRGAGPVTITVRGTTDGTCASSSAAINVSFAEEDLLGTYYYWKSTASSAGNGGQIWAKIFGDLGSPEKDVTSNITTATGTLAATCNGCHALSRDGSRMVVYSDDNDSDDEYTDVGGSLLDMTPLPNAPATELGVAVNGQRSGGQPPGFTTLNPLASSYVSSNGIPLTAAGAPPVGLGAGSSSTAGYPAAVPASAWSLWSGQGNFVGSVPIGASGTRPTMPDWSIDGTTVVYVQPSSVASWQLFFDLLNPNAKATDDDHVFGGSLYTVPYMGGGMFGAPTVLLQSGGENNYYPSYSPDVPMSFVVFNRVANNAAAGTSCSGGFCPNDSFSNPAARLMLVANAPNSSAIDLQKANGSPSGAPVPLSNSYPRWAPFVQSYHGQKLLWFTFSSTRDYGVRIVNHKPGMYQCYPPDEPETPAGVHGANFAATCQQPQLWMAPINLSEAQGTGDPSRVAFWLPYQDMTSHNHTAQWTAQRQQLPPPQIDAGACSCQMAVYGPCGAANGGCDCCPGLGFVCSGNNTCISPAR